MLDAIVVSDIHLGSDICQAKTFFNFLEKVEKGILKTKKLILNGDVFDNYDFRRLKKHHWNVLSQLRKMSDHIEIIWLCGNHDGPADIISHLLGVFVADEFIFESGTETILLFHGHIYDQFINDHPFLTWVSDVLYNLIQKVDWDSRFCCWLKQTSKTYLRCTEIIEQKALEHAKEKKATFVCCGHTHQPVLKEHYANSGCWTEPTCHYLTIKHGKVELKRFETMS